jgi:transcriptional regulator with XRE-family HTH domain
METIGERIRRARERAVLNQGELAEAAGLNRSSLSMIENGRKHPRMTTIRAIAHALGIPPGELVDPQ